MDSVPLKFAKMADAHKIEIWIHEGCQIQKPVAEEPTGESQVSIHELRGHIEESEVLEWSRKDLPLCNGTTPFAGLRLLMIRNPMKYPDVEFPMEEDTLKGLLREWKFPSLGEISSALYAGGSAVFKSSPENCKRISMN